MKIKVRTLATLYEVTKSFEHEIELPQGATVRDLLRIFVEKFPQTREMINLDDPLEDLMILVNGRHVQFLPEGLDTKLNEGDEVVLIPPSGGG